MSNVIIWIFIYIPLIIFATLLFLYLLSYLIAYKIYPFIAKLYYELSYSILVDGNRIRNLLFIGFIALCLIVGIYLSIYYLLIKKIQNKMNKIPILKDYFILVSIFIYLILFSIFITIILSPKKDIFMKIFTIIKDFFIIFFIIFIILFLIKLNNKLTINIDISKKVDTSADSLPLASDS